MRRFNRLMRRSRFVFILLLSATLIWPTTTVKSSATSLIPDPSMVRQDERPGPVSEVDAINEYIEVIAGNYGIDPELVKSVVWLESGYNKDAIGDSGRSIGLMQIQKRWHSARMEKLGVTDLADPYDNILVGTDYLAALIETQETTELALMVYNMGPARASELYTKGQISEYAKVVLTRAALLNSGGI